MENKISLASEKLVIVIAEEKIATDLSLLKIVLSAVLFFSVAFYLGISEIMIISLLLIIFTVGTNQVTELHFNKQTKEVYIAYSFFGKILKIKKELNDYSICHYKIVYETIAPVEESYQVYTLRAIEHYYHYNLYHFQKLEDAQLAANWLVEHLGIRFEDYNVRSS